MPIEFYNYILWVSTFFVVYHLVMYPCVIIGLSKIVLLLQLKKDDSIKFHEDISTSYIIAAYNEEKVIAEKLENTLMLKTPSGSFEVLVAADGSDDRTVEIVQRFESHGVKCLHKTGRQGKAAALNRAVSMASGDYLVFSDANNLFGKDAILHLIEPLHNENIGAVCGAKKIIKHSQREASKGDSLYWHYESKIKKAESDIGTTTALDGEIFAMRKAEYKPIGKNIVNDDSDITFSLIRQGKRIVYEDRAESYEKASISLNEDFNVKVRMIAGGFQTIFQHGLYLLKNPGWFSFAFISHKILRWLMPFFLIMILITTLVTISDLESRIYLGFQGIGILLALVGRYYTKNSLIGKLTYISYYFFMMNAAALKGFFRALHSTQSVNWSKAER